MIEIDSNLNSKKEKVPSEEDFEKLYKYFKSVLKKNTTLSIAFMGITLTAFIFLISLGYPEIIDIEEIILGISIKVVSLSLSILVLSFFLFLIATFLYHYCELRLDKLHLYWKPKHKLSLRYEKSEALYDGYYKFAYFLLFSGVIFLITAVTFI